MLVVYMYFRASLSPIKIILSDPERELSVLHAYGLIKVCQIISSLPTGSDFHYYCLELICKIRTKTEDKILERVSAKGRRVGGRHFIYSTIRSDIWWMETNRQSTTSQCDVTLVNESGTLVAKTMPYRWMQWNREKWVIDEGATVNVDGDEKEWQPTKTRCWECDISWYPSRSYVNAVLISIQVLHWSLLITKTRTWLDWVKRNKSMSHH